MNVKALALASLVMLGALATGCGEDRSDAGGSAGSALGPGITVAAALDSDLRVPLLVNGFLVVRGSDVRLCEALAESFPPQCGGNSLAVTGLGLSNVKDLREASGVRWTELPVQVLGSVRDGALVVDGQSLAGGR